LGTIFFGQGTAALVVDGLKNNPNQPSTGYNTDGDVLVVGWQAVFSRIVSAIGNVGKED
jgi:hypothetical protein